MEGHPGLVSGPQTGDVASLDWTRHGGLHQVHLQEKDEAERSASVFWHVEKIHTILAVGLGMNG